LVFTFSKKHGVCMKRFYKEMRPELTRRPQLCSFISLFVMFFFVQPRVYVSKKVIVSIS
jgi:hypothetical protein